jgi:hypothetical protein
MGMITVVTDVVRENNQTYRLGYTEMCKDGTKMGVGSPEYVLLMRKPQSDRSRGYADVPVDQGQGGLLARALAGRCACLLAIERQPAADRRRARQLGPARSRSSPKQRERWRRVYDYERMSPIGEALEAAARCRPTFMALAPGSHIRTCGTTSTACAPSMAAAGARRVEKHVCPLQFDIVDRLIERYSNKGDLVFDPFGGLMTVPYRAITRTSGSCCASRGRSTGRHARS